MPNDDKKSLRLFIREEVWRTVSRTAGLVGGADLGGIARSGKPQWPLSSGPDEDEAAPYDVQDPEFEDDVEVLTYPGNEVFIIQGKRERKK
jgi:hypothetical protein